MPENSLDHWVATIVHRQDSGLALAYLFIYSFLLLGWTGLGGLRQGSACVLWGRTTQTYRPLPTRNPASRVPVTTHSAVLSYGIATRVGVGVGTDDSTTSSML